MAKSKTKGMSNIRGQGSTNFGENIVTAGYNLGPITPSNRRQNALLSHELLVDNLNDKHYLGFQWRVRFDGV